MKLFMEIDIENGEVKSMKVINREILLAKPELSSYARCFDEGCTGWTKDSEVNMMFLKQQEMYANDLLKERGYLYLNEVYDMLGLPRSRAGQCVGWVYDEKNPIGDNKVDFGLALKMNMAFMNGFTNKAWLDFNVDGNILELVEEGA